MNPPPSDHDRIDNNVQATLDCFDKLGHIEASPFFYTRLKSAINSASLERTNWLYRITRGYKLLPATLVVIVVLNVVSLSLAFSLRHPFSNTAEADQNESVFAYSLSRWSMISEMGR